MFELEQGQEESQVQPQAAEQEAPQQQELVDLSTLGKFKVSGNEMTFDDLQKSILFQKDYTKKTQALSEDRKKLEEQHKFDTNLRADLLNVMKDPSLADKFRQVYPQQYHDVLEALLNKTPATETKQNVDPALMNRLSKLEQFHTQQQHKLRESEVAASQAAIDSLFTKLQPKYPLADEQIVIAHAQALMEQGAQLMDEKGNLIEGTWDKIWKNVQEATEKRFTTYQKEQLTKQKTANAKGRDVASGGGIPGQAPKKMTIKEASEHAISVLSGRQ